MAVGLLVGGFSALVLAVRGWQNAESRSRVKKDSIWIAMAVILFAVAGGVSFWRYAGLARAEGEAARENVYDAFAAAPKLARLANAGLSPGYTNDDSIDLDGTTSLTVSLYPSNRFLTQFIPWQSVKNKRVPDKLWIKLRIAAPGFDVSPVLDETQQVPEDSMTFAWILRARQTGDQELNISGVAFRETASGQIYDRATVVNTMRAIQVRAAFPIEAWTTIVTTFTTVLLGGSLPFLFQALKPSRSQASTGLEPAVR